MKTSIKSSEENPFADSAKTLKGDPFAGLCKICNKALLAALIISAVLLGTSMVAGFITFVVIGVLRVRHPEAEYPIQTDQIFWFSLAICILIFSFGVIYANCHSEPTDLED